MMTVQELVDHLRKFDPNGIVEVVTEEKVFQVEVDPEAPFSEEYRSGVALFLKY